jgi:hypothetical protein
LKPLSLQNFSISERVTLKNYFANAERVTDWEEFKRKLNELNKKPEQYKKLKFSPEMDKKMKGFLEYIKEETAKRKKTKKLIPLVPYTLFIMAVLIDEGPSKFISSMNRHFGGFLTLSLVILGASYGLYWLIPNIVLKNFKKSLLFKKWCFWSASWCLFWFLFSFIFRWFHIEDPRLYLLMFAPPIFIALGYNFYNNHIK